MPSSALALGTVPCASRGDPPPRPPAPASAVFSTLPASMPASSDAATSSVAGEVTDAMSTVRDNEANAMASGRTSSSEPPSRRTMAMRTPLAVGAVVS